MSNSLGLISQAIWEIVPMWIYPGQSSAEAIRGTPCQALAGSKTTSLRLISALIEGPQAQRARQVRTVSTLRSGASSTVNVARASESKPDVNLGGSGQEALK